MMQAIDQSSRAFPLNQNARVHSPFAEVVILKEIAFGSDLLPRNTTVWWKVPCGGLRYLAGHQGAPHSVEEKCF